MKRGLIFLILAVGLLVPAASAKRITTKDDDFNLDFVVESASMIPGTTNIFMSLRNGQRTYQVRSACLVHCWIFNPGDHLSGKFWEANHEVVILFTERESGKRKLAFYTIENVVLH